ncbi:MAG: hypothetical protein WAT12_07085 [Candidatus Nitrotoga sp.]
MKKQTALGILGTLILGALGSGLWELIKPGFSFLGSTALTIISLGFDSVVNDIYTRVGRANLVSVWVRGTTLLVIATAIGVAAGVILQRARAPSIDPLSRRRTIWTALLLSLVGSYLLFGSFRHTYVASTRGYFEYLTRASAPYLTNDQRLAMDSRLALVRSRADYEKLVVELKALLKANNVTVAEQD